MKRFLFILITILSICSMPCMADITEVFNSAKGRAWFGITTSDAATSTVKSVTSSETGIQYQYVNTYNGSGLGAFLMGTKTPKGWLSFKLPETTTALKVLTGKSASTGVIIDIYGNNTLIQSGYALDAQNTEFTINLPEAYQAAGTTIKLACGNTKNPQFQQITYVTAATEPEEPEESYYSVTYSTRSLNSDGTENNYTILGSVSKSDDKTSYHNGDQIIFTATPYDSETTKFLYFIVDGNRVSENPYTYSVEAHDGEIIAVFQQKKMCHISTQVCYLEDDGSLKANTLDKLTISPTSSEVAPGTILTLTAEPYFIHRLEYFLINGVQYTDNPLTITAPEEDLDIKAIFTPIGYKISYSNWYTWEKPIDKENECTITLSPEKEEYNMGDVVTLTANPAEYFRFEYFKINGVKYSNNPTTFTVSGDLNIRVYYSEVPEAYLGMSVYELDGDYTFNVDLNKCGKIMITRGNNVYTLPDDQWPTLHSGDKLSIEIIPNPGYKFEYAYYSYEEPVTKITSSKFDIELTGEHHIAFYFSQPDKVRTYSYTTDSRLYDSYIQANAEPGSVDCSAPDHELRIGDTLTFTANPTPGFKVKQFEVRVTNQGSTIRYNKYESDTFKFTIGKYDEEIAVTAYFAVDMPSLSFSSYHDYSYEKWLSMIDYTLSPEPIAQSNSEFYYLPDTDVTLTFTPTELNGNKLFYTLVDEKGTGDNPIQVRMDKHHEVCPVIYRTSRWGDGYIQYDRESGIIDFYPKAWGINGFMIDNKFGFCMNGDGNVNINLHPAFGIGQYHFLLVASPNAMGGYYYDELHVMTAPKFSVQPKDFTIAGFGSGSVTIYEIAATKSETAQLELEVKRTTAESEDETLGWYTPEEYIAMLPSIYAEAGLAVMPRELGYYLSGMRVYDYYNDTKGNPVKIYSSTTEIPTYEYIRDNGWQQIGVDPTYTLTASTFLNSTTADNVGNVTFDPQKEAYDYGDMVTVTAVAADDYQFKEFSIDNKTYSENPITIMVNGDKQIDARFREAPDQWLWVRTMELDNNMEFDLDLRDAGNVTFTCGENVQTLPIPYQGDQYVTFKQGNRVNVEVQPNAGYEFSHAILQTENGERKLTEPKFDLDFSFYEGGLILYFTQPAKEHVYTVKTQADVIGETELTPGTISCSKTSNINAGDKLTFTTTDAYGFEFNNFYVNISYRGQTIKSYSIEDNPLVLSVEDGEYEISVTASFKITMPKITLLDNDHIGEFLYGIFEFSPEPVAIYNNSAHYQPDTEVSVTFHPWDYYKEKCNYLNVDNTKLPGNKVALTMDSDHTLAIMYHDYNFNNTSYSRYDQETGLIDFHEDAANLHIDCFANHEYSFTVCGTDTIDINRHKAFEPGKSYKLRFHDLEKHIAERHCVMTAPKFGISQCDIPLTAFGSGFITVYVVDTTLDPTSELEVEAEKGNPNGDHYTMGWMSVDAYNSLFPSLYTEPGLTILPRELGYWLTGIRVKQYDSSDYQTHYSKRVEIPTYDYIRDNGWTGIDIMGVSAEEEIFDMDGHQIKAGEADLEPGVYIVRRGATVRKLIK